MSGQETGLLYCKDKVDKIIDFEMFRKPIGKALEISP